MVENVSVNKAILSVCEGGINSKSNVVRTQVAMLIDHVISSIGPERFYGSSKDTQVTIINYLIMITLSQCLKITEKVSFNIASKASYVYILNGQKLIKNAQNGPFWRVFENLKLAVKQCYQTGGKYQNSKIQMRHFE